MTEEKVKPNGGFSIHFSWAQFVSLIIFFLMVGPALIFVGKVAERIDNVEIRTDELSRSVREHEAQFMVLNSQTAVLNAQYSEILSKLEQLHEEQK